MQIIFSPVRKDTVLQLERRGDTLMVNDALFDFSDLEEGDAREVESDWVIGPVVRHAGMLRIMLLLSHGAQAPQETLFPEPLVVDVDGAIAVPPFEALHSDRETSGL